MEKLYLDDNKLKTINSELFKGISELKTLDLNAIGLTKLDGGVFEQLANLEHLYLFENRLSLVLFCLAFANIIYTFQIQSFVTDANGTAI